VDPRLEGTVEAAAFRVKLKRPSKPLYQAIAQQFPGTSRFCHLTRVKVAIIAG